jgi:hypothetical protein
VKLSSFHQTPNPSIEGTSNIRLRRLLAAPHVKRSSGASLAEGTRPRNDTWPRSVSDTKLILDHGNRGQHEMRVRLIERQPSVPTTRYRLDTDENVEARLELGRPALGDLERLVEGALGAECMVRRLGGLLGGYVAV